MAQRYDAGLLNDYGGGNVEWWQDYIRAELARCTEYYEGIIVDKGAEITRLNAVIRAMAKWINHEAWGLFVCDLPTDEDYSGQTCEQVIIDHFTTEAKDVQRPPE